MFRYGKILVSWSGFSGRVEMDLCKMIETEGLYDMYSFWTSAERECDSNGSCSVTWRDYYTTSLDALNTSTNYHESKGTEDCLAVAYMEEAPTKTITDVFCDSETML
ncbi:unnamed protein product [Caenorhabditis nigoni]